ncbi:MAG TPA: beta-ketoacyl synthase N-terminal-like domain-containing protein [Albitalea sp.]|uniref:beta-ketoacyl synthase N-terminal-like domain-containing protein n=1 Tax=Piscinibacter sp. TaxID=1903157 RepID=UPI002ED263EA
MDRALSVLRLGAVTPVGLTAAQTAACVRAGLSGFVTRQLLPPPAEPTICATVPASRRLKRSPREWLLNLATRAAAECLADFAPSQPVALLLAVPEPFRHHPALHGRSDAATLAELQTRLARRLAPASRVLRSGQASVCQALLQARSLLNAGEVTACLVGGVDSLLEPADIDRLQRSGWLHGPDNPQGLIPGEGAAFLLLGGDAGQPAAPPLARILAAATAQEQDHALTERFACGDGLRAAIETALQQAGVPEAEVKLRVTDMNGERYRAWDSMLAAGRSYGTRRETFPVWHTASRLGDLGAAAGFAGVLCAAMGLHRGYAPGPTVVCESASDEGLRGACVMVPARGAPLPPFLSRLHAEQGAAVVSES